MMNKKKAPKGLGDVVKNVTDALGIEPCEGCEKRREWLNNLITFRKTKELSEEDFIKVGQFIERNKTNIIFREDMKRIKLSNEDFEYLEYLSKKQFNMKGKLCKSCPGELQILIEDLYKLYDAQQKG